jgi:hypothetical protein
MVISTINTSSNAKPQRHTHFFLCPGCGYAHCFTDTEVGYNGNAQKPTFLNQYHIPGHIALFKCRSTISKGKITFADDCTHESAGLTVKLKDIQ